MAGGIKRKIKAVKNIEMTIEDILEIYIQEKKALNKSEKTIINIQGSMKRWMDYLVLSDYSMNISDVDSSYVYSFMNHCLNEEMKPTTLNHYLRDIRAFVYWCIDKKYITDAFKVKLATEDEVIKDTYTDEEMELLLQKPHRDASFVEFRTWAIINWIFATGNRASTVCSIQMKDLNFTKKEIIIQKTKTHKAMIIPFSPSLMTCIKDYIRRFRSDATDEEFLFPNVGNLPLTVNALKSSVQNYNKSRGVDKTSVHAFRHTFAKNWIRATGDVFRLQKLLGHSTLEMTKRYVNMFSDDLKEGFEKFNPLDRMKQRSSRTHAIKRNNE